MAELPDLSVFAKTLNHYFKGHPLKEVEVTVAKKLNVTVDELRKKLEGKKLELVQREGKTLEFHFSGGNILGLHLMLRGELTLLGKENPSPKYEILRFDFGRHGSFAVTDILKQAKPTLNPAPVKAPDALSIGREDFLKMLFKKTTPIKTLLMDQKQIRGIGNSYADELLWEARISPFSSAKAIPEKQAIRLYDLMKQVLEEAIETIAELNGNELRGELRDVMKIHGANIEKSPTGKPIKSEKLNGRTAYYTDEQKLFN
ncbi:DNA-formamidopyrimidine glycosylase family protein [Pedobacter xixiisoli]|uniref:Formamidopyrimidine-DNA glycosylase n=1 Tax=Pedobacter xixiisoli TaxID=1476464 RepID=A0A285ZWH9_9SPHI|nr:DNA-formamidopyrimidine glycosylase family protein [Pedobacter xixiisoli]SOD13990.1 formamidopyrimidine-DNA glycosylase [Pedobacter xixiisoli]